MKVTLFALFTLYFLGALFGLLTWHRRLKPRVVPYFARTLADHGGPTMAAFPRGRALYREMPALDALADRAGVRRLSAFGFADDLFGQAVAWHDAAAALDTVAALRAAVTARPDLVWDLEALQRVLEEARDRGVPFALVVRLRAKDSLQAVMTREARQGSFW